MSIKEYLISKQPIVYKVLQNSFSKNKTSHAYIINGPKGSPVKDIAMFMAKSFVCQNKDEYGLACECCTNCMKIEKNGYVDFKFYNGEDLKTGETLSLQDDFSKSAIENENTKIYIVDKIEKAPIASLNKLLKFIEEPESNIKAIFTSNSKEAILPTIVSRCQVITLKEFMVNDLAKYLEDNGVAKEDAILLSKISNNSEKNLELAKSEKYQKIKEILDKSLSYLQNKDDYFIVYFQTEAMKKLEDDELDLYLDMLEMCYLEALIKKEDTEYEINFYGNYIQNIANKYSNIDKAISDITIAKLDLLSNANKNLVFDKLLINLTRR